MKYLLLLLTAIITFSSCSFEQTYHFNKDLGGKYKLMINMTEFAKKMGKQDQMKKEMEEGKPGPFEKPNPNLNNMTCLEYVESAPGVSGVKVANDIENSSSGLELNFESLDAMNNALNYFAHFQKAEKDETAKLGDYKFFVKDGKWLTIRQEPSPKSETEEDKQQEEAAKKMMEGMAFVFEYHFESKIKKVKSEIEYTIADDKKSFRAELPILKAQELEELFKVKI